MKHFQMHPRYCLEPWSWRLKLQRTSVQPRRISTGLLCGVTLELWKRPIWLNLKFFTIPLLRSTFSYLVLSFSCLVLISHSDQKEGVQAFFEKRKPNFRANLDDNPPARLPWWTEVDTGRAPKASPKL